MSSPTTTSLPQPSWPQLLRVALLGTRQSGEPVPAVFDTATASTDDREKQLLLAAGTLALMRRAGYQPPVVATPAPVPALPDPVPPLGPLGTTCLQRMLLDAQHPEMLPEYLQQIAAAGRRVPDSLLPYLLRHAAGSSETVAVLAPVAGTRGRWLAALNPAWHTLLAASSASGVLDLEPWETGTLPTRRTWLRTRFEQDAAAARALLLPALPTEPAKAQEAFLNILADYLHPDTEPVLETLLRARGQEVRRQAAALLVRLPGAALVERLWARAAPLLTVKRGLLGLGKITLEVTLPTTWDKSWLTDGIEEKNDQYAYYSGTGNRATPLGPSAIRLGNLLALLPPGRWTAHLGVSADDLLAAALASEWVVPLLPCWAISTLTHQDTDFAAAFLHLWLHQRPTLQKNHADRNIDWAALTELLPAATRQQLLLKPMLLRVRRQEPRWTDDLLQLPTPWPHELTTEVLQSLSAKLANSATLERFHSDLYQLTYFISQHLAPAVAPADAPLVETTLLALPEVHSTFQNSIHNLLETLRFRAELAASLEER
ncbi:hypothetical protein J0X19_12125 [Hymenobacter sp. BT186]|uniref:Uncharacterized protein n=1 Tax=Hymenobacter telluris TaxID=2816474 RepID=A0A939EX00_9BACT|nr:DUF5691 domain-containing protein [Hymenobacter telluris]MBO0358696.1 hypothetical protein [Hymenobacter telluris]MBW3374722.1 hypothetical protein [Hymenobacter norwichensis]